MVWSSNNSITIVNIFKEIFIDAYGVIATLRLYAMTYSSQKIQLQQIDITSSVFNKSLV